MQAKNIWRIQLKPDKNSSITYRELLEYCKTNHLIGIGWQAVTMRDTDPDKIRSACSAAYPDGVSRAYKAVHQVSQIEEGDLIWTRLGEDASEYYLFRASDKLWKDTVIPLDDQRKYDISNAVSADWVLVGKQKNVPGKVVNAFCPPATIQPVYDVSLISMELWNQLSPPDAPKYDRVTLRKEEFWKWIGSEELECLVLLYLQTLGYYMYSSTAKVSNPKYEAVMVYKDGSHFAYPQVKRGIELDAVAYSAGIDPMDKVFLFTTSQNYGKSPEKPDNVVCITKDELWNFMMENPKILTITVKDLLAKVNACI